MLTWFLSGLLFQHFDWDLAHLVLFLYILPSHHMNLRDQHDWKMLIHWCRTDICSCKLSAKVSLILDNPFLVPSLCKFNHISLCFIQISTKSAYTLQGKQCFFWSHPRCFGLLRKFQYNIKISIKAASVSRLSVSYDYGLTKTDQHLHFLSNIWYPLKSIVCYVNETCTNNQEVCGFLF